VTAPFEQDEPVARQTPQPVLTPLTTAAIFLVMTINDGGEPVVREVLTDLSGLQRTVGFRAPEQRLALVTGIGSAAWDRLFTGPRPAGLHPFGSSGVSATTPFAQEATCCSTSVPGRWISVSSSPRS